VRVVLDLHRGGNGNVHGVVITEGDKGNEQHAFAGWLDLLRVLEALTLPAPSARTGDEHAQGP
jgi:hypothetical protein